MEPTEVYEVIPDKGRPYFSYKPLSGCLATLSPDSPLPIAGDVLLLPSNVTGDLPDQAFILGGLGTPFKVVERELMYRVDGTSQITPFSKAHIYVRRMTEEEYELDPGRRNK